MLTRFETSLRRSPPVSARPGAPTDIERVVLRECSSIVIRPLVFVSLERLGWVGPRSA